MLTIEQIRNVITDYFKDKPVKKVWLFGSYARGEAKEDSDIDLLVNYDDTMDTVSLFDILRMKIELNKKFKKKVELVEEGRVYHRFQPYIDKDRLKLYEV